MLTARPAARLLAVVAAAALLPAARAAATPLDVDPSFGTSGVVRSGGAQGGAWSALQALPDGGFLAAGQVAPGKAAVARFTAAGALDPSWAADQPVPGVLTLGGGTGITTVPNDLLLLADGRVLVGETTTSTTTTTTAKAVVQRLTADGHVDSGFGTSGRTELTATGGFTVGALALQSSGAIVVAGRTVTGSSAGLVGRLGADGAPDSAFGTSGQTRLALGSNQTRFYDLAIDAGDRILVAGSRTSDGGRRQLAVARLSAGGIPDITYGVHDNEYVTVDLDGADPATNDVDARRMRLDGSGRVLLAATVQASAAGGAHLVGLARLDAAGALDPAFGDGGTRTQDVSPSHVTDLADLAPLDGGGFAVAGRMAVGGATQFAVAGYHADGSPDTGLNPGHAPTANAANLSVGDGGNDQAGALALLPSGRLLVAGSTVDGAGDTGAIARLGGSAPGGPQPPVAAFSSSYAHPVATRPIRPGQTVTFDAGASSDPDGTIAAYAWDLDGNGQTDHTGPVVTTTFAQPGPHGVLLRVTDAQGLTATTGATLAVGADIAPTASITASQGTPKAGQSFTLNATGKDTDGTVASYAWDLDGNGSYETPTGATPKVTTSRDTAGPTFVAVRVTDDEGATGVAKTGFLVDEAPCLQHALVKVGKAVIAGPSSADAGGAGCFRVITSTKDGVSTSTYTTTGHFTVNKIEVDTLGSTKATIVYKRKVTPVAGKPNVFKDGDTLELSLTAPNTKVTAMSEGTDFAFRDGPINWKLGGDHIAGFKIDPNAGIGGLPLKVAGEPKLEADGRSSLDISPGAPAELLGKTPSAPVHTVFGAPQAGAAAVGAFSFKVDTIPLGVVTLGPVTITYDGAGRWDISAEASMAVPVPTSLKGHLALVDGKVKSVSLHLKGAITAGPILITSLGMSIDFGPKVDADPDCVKHVGLEDITPDWTFLDQAVPGLKKQILAQKPSTSPLFHKLFRDYHTPNFAICGDVGLSVAEIVDADVSFGFARYKAPLPNVFVFHGQATLIKLINATIDAQITTAGYVHINAQVSGGYPSADPWIGWKLGLDFEYFKQQFNAEAYAKITIVPLDASVGAQLLASNKGIVACISIGTPFGDWHPGGGAKWGHGPKLYLFGCDVNEYKVVINNAAAGDIVIGPPVASSRSADGGLPVVSAMPKGGTGNDATLVRLAGTPPTAAQRSRLRAAAVDAAPQAIELPAGLPGTVMAFKGAGAPPHVVLHGPKGESYDTGAGNVAATQPTFVAYKDASTQITQVALAKPSAGRWTVEVAADSTRLVEAIQADGVAAVTATGTVGGSGQARELRYRVTNLREGEHLEFVEVGAAAGSIIGRVDANGNGVLPFHPGIGAAGKRDLQAVVTGPDGYMRDRISLGTYTAPSPARPARTKKLVLKAAGRALVLSWPRDRQARTTQVDVRTSTGLNFTKIVKRPGLRIPRPPAGTRLVITLMATSKDGIAGRPATFKRTLPRPKPKKASRRKRS